MVPQACLGGLVHEVHGQHGDGVGPQLHAPGHGGQLHGLVPAQRHRVLRRPARPTPGALQGQQPVHGAGPPRAFSQGAVEDHRPSPPLAQRTPPAISRTPAAISPAGGKIHPTPALTRTAPVISRRSAPHRASSGPSLGLSRCFPSCPLLSTCVHFLSVSELDTFWVPALHRAHGAMASPRAPARRSQYRRALPYARWKAGAVIGRSPPGPEWRSDSAALPALPVPGPRRSSPPPPGQSAPYRPCASWTA